jgi:hypothetical protein
LDGHVRVCRDCGEEYRPDILRCADCGGELEDRYPGSDARAAAPPPPAVPEAEPAAGHALYRSSQVRDLVPMAERLRERAIECRIAEQPGGSKDAPPHYVLVVREEDATAALAAVADLMAPGVSADLHAVESRYDRERGYLQCPACGAAQPSGARECPECGLGLAGEEAAEGPPE